MNSISSLIIDDERLACFTLKNKLADFPNIDVIGEAGSIKEAIVKINKFKPQLLFLDIQLMDGNGFDLLNQINFEGKIIFVTAYDEYAIRAFDINAIDYLLKPISTKRLEVAIDKLNNEKNQEWFETVQKLYYNDRLMVMHKKSVNFIIINTISTITASREYSYIHTIDGRDYLTSKNISVWENRLPDQNFCRIHRSTIINFDHIIKIEHNSTGSAKIVIQGISEPFNISRNYFKKIKERYNL